MKKVDLRKIQILKIIVEEYIQTGDIVGSKSLLKKHEIGVSSATVRNDMASLEKMGLIFQPYNSAGRLLLRGELSFCGLSYGIHASSIY